MTQLLANSYPDRYAGPAKLYLLTGAKESGSERDELNEFEVTIVQQSAAGIFYRIGQDRSEPVRLSPWHRIEEVVLLPVD